MSIRFNSNRDLSVILKNLKVEEKKQEKETVEPEEVAVEDEISQSDGDINGDFATTFWSRFIGNTTNVLPWLVESNTMHALTNLLELKTSGKPYAACFSLHAGNASISGSDGSSLDYEGGGNHTFAITDITTTTVTFINPWDSTTEYTVTWEEFAKLGAYRYDVITW